jgi:hypothetical protein
MPETGVGSRNEAAWQLMRILMVRMISDGSASTVTEPPVVFAWICIVALSGQVSLPLRLLISAAMQWRGRLSCSEFSADSVLDQCSYAVQRERM